MPKDIAMISITVRYFASLRDRLGKAEELLTIPLGFTVADVWRTVAPDASQERILAAINHEYVQFESAVSGGDELAFFPPVTGG